MTKGGFAKEEVMEEYLGALLNEPEEEVVKKEQLSKLLASAAAPALREYHVPEDVRDEDPIIDEVQVIESLAEKEKQNTSTEPRSKEITEPFQALFFEVAGLILAVPLINLGGIHQLDKIGPLFGKPDWFKGVMLHREEKLSVVDTARWVMPEKYNEALEAKLNYRYLVMLDDSGWGLACEKLITTTTLNPEDVKWRGPHSKRPWLAGLVKEKMCALINVEQLVAMLEKGQGSNEQ